jgi:hypothetical protein
MPARLTKRFDCSNAELKLNIYTRESVAAAVLQLRIPHVPAHQLAAWFTAGPAGKGWMMVLFVDSRLPSVLGSAVFQTFNALPLICANRQPSSIPLY